MKSLLFAMGLVSFVMYRAAKFDVDLRGTWQGSYKTTGKIVDVKIVFGQDNSIELYSGEIKETGKATGSYSVSNSNERLITLKWPGGDHIFFTMNGRLSRKRNFLDGDWESDDHSHGSFYLQKQY